jgi:hypothetical protein
VSFEKRKPKPRPEGFRNDFNSFRRPLDGNRLDGPRRPAPRPHAPRTPRRKGPPPQVRVPESPRHRRDMLKAAAWRLSKIIHCQPAKILASDDPASLIKVRDSRASQLVKKIVRLKKPATKKPA